MGYSYLLSTIYLQRKLKYNINTYSSTVVDRSLNSRTLVKDSLFLSWNSRRLKCLNYYCIVVLAMASYLQTVLLQVVDARAGPGTKSMNKIKNKAKMEEKLLKKKHKHKHRKPKISSKPPASPGGLSDDVAGNWCCILMPKVLLAVFLYKANRCGQCTMCCHVGASEAHGDSVQGQRVHPMIRASSCG